MFKNEYDPKAIPNRRKRYEFKRVLRMQTDRSSHSRRSQGEKRFRGAARRTVTENGIAQHCMQMTPSPRDRRTRYTSFLAKPEIASKPTTHPQERRWRAVFSCIGSVDFLTSFHLQRLMVNNSIK
ncbi:hypothetical protein EVAR_93587_1 [Eumeta japonica]|uniref:Uncharacterized protein n=1 Tax=Eumeta variegata TaxID=151549 RepID=A0A4C1SAF9_EUMVA|nr:hypothetical protein EVAR_93587_1 [Eumeta japonica]